MSTPVAQVPPAPLAQPAPSLSIVLAVTHADPGLDAWLQQALADDSPIPVLECILCEAGSISDIARPNARQAATDGRLKTVHEMPRLLGRSLRRGLSMCRGDTVLLLSQADIDNGFVSRGLDLLRSGQAELVAGSRRLPGQRDGRDLAHQLASRLLHGLLQGATGYAGTDSRGPLLMQRRAMSEVVEACLSDSELFVSELVIRAGRMARKVVEIPADAPHLSDTTYARLRWAPDMLKDLARLTSALRLHGQ